MKSKQFKKIYLEITNACNLSCPFCIKNKRPIKYFNLNDLKIILPKLEPYTDYLYFHLLGEPLFHPNINELIDYASKTFNIQITTNGYLIDKIKDNKNIRRINISLHSFDPKYGISLDKYMNNIFNTIDNLITNNTYISLRLWTSNKYKDTIIGMIKDYYHCNNNLDNKNNIIKDKLFLQYNEEFIWPDLNNDYYNEVGTCYGLRDHIGILSDGTIVPCCLDTKGIINLGNIYYDNLSEVLDNKNVTTMIDGFKQNKKVNELCKHCLFLRK